MVARAYQPEDYLSPEPAPERLTPAEYLRREREAETKSEFIAGELCAMSGASRRHVRIVNRITVYLERQLEGSSCEVMTNDIRVKVNERGDYVYPDAVVVYDGGEYEDRELDTLLNPVIIIEVLSPSTQGRDRGAKWLRYQRIVSLSDYVMISQDEMRVEHYHRHTGGHWLYQVLESPDDTLELSSITCRLMLRQIYERVNFDESDSSE